MATFLRGNCVIHRTRKVIQVDDNGHVGRPCEVSLAPPYPEPFALFVFIEYNIRIIYRGIDIQ